MQFSARAAQITGIKTGCIVIGVFEGRKLTASAEEINKTSDGFIVNMLRRGDLGDHPGATLLLQDPPGLAAQRLMLVRLGRKSELDARRYRQIAKDSANALLRTNAKDAVHCLAEAQTATGDLHWRVRQIVDTMRAGAYRFERLKPRDTERALRRVDIHCADRTASKAADGALTEGAAISDGVDFARDLGNLPGNLCTPSVLADEARQLAKGRANLKVKVLEERDMKRLKMGSLLSVSAGSREPAKLIVMEYTGTTASRAPVVLVGKGVTFDTGGISLKPGAGMDEMKFDMCGAASVLGVMKSLSTLKPKINVVGLIPATENMPDGLATKPGDVVTSMSGQTIEILNTDAEGRLILCDALTYAERYKPDAVVDIATLTGACVVALGAHPTGLFSNDDDLSDALIDAGEFTADRAWRMPVWEEYQDQLKSNFADMANVGGRAGGAITAACFLARFTRKFRWAHLDIAGTAWLSGANKGATGRPVPLLMQYLLNKTPKSTRPKR
ncbi:MAG: leucyl aminopeptidase [Gammaproteobacteria bacterium]|nr:leucyl aminopeptidase [Gammaproteobacteria bacterium]